MQFFINTIDGKIPIQILGQFMKTVITLTLLYLSLTAQGYQQGKIDMHGGSYDDSYKNTSVKRNFACMSDFLDKNSSSSTKKQKNSNYK